MFDGIDNAADIAGAVIQYSNHFVSRYFNIINIILVIVRYFVPEPDRPEPEQEFQY